MSSSFDDHPHPATILIATDAPNGAKRRVPATYQGMEGKRLILDTAERVGLSAPVSIEYNDAMFLGEVMLCKSGSDGRFRVEVMVEQILTGLQSLIALRAGLLGELAAAKTPGFVPVAVR